MSETEEPDIRLDRMITGRFDESDVEWVINCLRRLQEAAMKVPFGPMRDSGMYDVLADQDMVYPFDGLHHAPGCPANHYHKQRPPSGPCSCGAAYYAKRKESK